MTVPTMPVVLGTSSLGTHDGAEELADAIIASPHAVDTSNEYGNHRSELRLGEAIARAGGLRDGKIIYSKNRSSGWGSTGCRSTTSTTRSRSRSSRRWHPTVLCLPSSRCANRA